MADSQNTTAPPRRPRSDARRSIDAILNAARIVLGERIDASMEDIAAAAGVTRQTVYAHFPSRDALVAALVEAAAAEYDALLDDAGLDTAPPAAALAQFLSAGWRFLARYPLLLNAATIPRPESDPHDFGPPRLERLIERGQRTGDFTPSLPAAWLAAIIFGLQHTAVAQVATGRLTTDEAEALCLETTLRLCGVETPH
ncbi:MAG: TetR family transcriptional regulator [Nocardia sp.]|uniref:TetR/AcrR family transcriptional regulator n=1 Tax=Nocardia sp. TaxID=1821 RepID=UPI00262DF6F6|nr:TetR/AcrR family transcriptional regulator [Nocardia sp.]MCU1641450.1 TetR family transcriptional regulator [Nocardia sp.]